MMNNFLIESADSLSLQKEIENLVKENNFLDASKSIYDMSEVLLESALEDLDTYSFLTSKKIIIIDGIDKVNQDDNKKDIKHLMNYLENSNSDNLLIITSNKLNNTLKITKDLKKKCKYISVNFDAGSFAKSELEGYKLETGALTLLLNYCHDDLTKLQQECSKLKTYKFETKTISKDDILEMVQEKLGDATELTFSFTRSIASRDKKEALTKYQELLDYNIEPLGIVGLLASQIRIMYQVKCLEDKGYTNSRIAETLEEKPYRVGKTRELTRHFSKKELLNLMTTLADMDMKIKTGEVDPNLLIQVFILNL